MVDGQLGETQVVTLLDSLLFVRDTDRVDLIQGLIKRDERFVFAVSFLIEVGTADTTEVSTNPNDIVIF